MKSGRSEFLYLLVQELDRTGISWCCLRNHLEFFENSRSDVDLMILPEDQDLFERTLEEVGRQTSAKLLQKASYLNQSRTYLTPAGEWVRIDYETEVRWGIFPVLTARGVLHRRFREGHLWLASPADESVVLWIAGLFRGQLSDRYRTRLLELAPLVKNEPRHARIFQETFGGMGRHLLSWQRLLSARGLEKWTWLDFKVALWTQPLLHAGKVILLLQYFFLDVVRLMTRLQSPPGILIQINSEFWERSDSLNFLWMLDPVFPVAKAMQWDDSVLTSWFAKIVRYGRLYRTLFKGGVALILCAGEKLVLTPFSLRRFVIQFLGEGRWIGASLSSGRMANAHNSNPAGACLDALLKLLPPPPSASLIHRPLFCVLLGLDGSGKTTLARSLVTLAPPELGVIYYRHFLPKTRNTLEFPWPGQPSKPKTRLPHAGSMHVILSVVRLLRNTLRAVLSRWGWRGPLGEKGSVTLVDRYLYNYLLDPASVAYAGSPALARLALRLAPRPDIIFVLEAPAHLLTQRKGELSPKEIEEQSLCLREMPLYAKKVVRLDGSLPPETLARQCCEEIRRCIGGV